MNFVYYNNRRVLFLSMVVMLFLSHTGGVIFCKINNNKNAKKNEKPTTKDGSPVLAWSNNEPILTQKDVDKQKEQLIEAQPELAQGIKDLPVKYIDPQIAEMLLQQDLVERYIKDSGIDKTSEYQKDLAIAQKMAKTMVDSTHFSNTISGADEVSDKELREYYEKNKIKFVKERGGITTVGVSFSSEQEANKFLKEVGNNDLRAEAEKQALEIVDFGLISENSTVKTQVNKDMMGWGSAPVDEAIKKAVLGFKKFPQSVMVQDGEGKVWIIQGVAKKEEVFEPFAEVKENLRMRLLQSKIANATTQKINELKEKYTITINEEFFGAENPFEISEEEIEEFRGALDEMSEEELAELM